MYRPQYLEQKYLEQKYLEQKYEVITVHKGNGEKVHEFRRPIQSDTHKRKESNEVISFRRRRKVK
ncbi:hypothetical protein AAH990_04280 [Enterococcus lactis]|uniref:hypothetical protein n=1 Tax=Enterococcus TaxID=1350 RepID=UPI00064CBA57|nr:hypothetical protein [Enterococcus faecium]QAT22618.1 hypothetical protein EQV91_04925 [Enterococcus faecium]